MSSPGFSDLSIASKIRGLVLIAPMCAKDRATRFHKRQVWWWYVNIIIIELFVTRPTGTILSHQSIYFSIHPGQGLGSRVKRHQFSKKAGNHLNLILPLDVYKWNNSKLWQAYTESERFTVTEILCQAGQSPFLQVNCQVCQLLIVKFGRTQEAGGGCLLSVHCSRVLVQVL